MNGTELFSIGHSNHSIGQFIDLLKLHEIESLVDVRRYPSSRRLPHFNRPNLAEALQEHGIDYHWLEPLGGHRKKAVPDSPNDGIRDPSFRNYADHMLGEEFRAGVVRLLEIAERTRTAIMCVEQSFHECHRKLISDFLVASRIAVQHILVSGEFPEAAFAVHRSAEILGTVRSRQDSTSRQLPRPEACAQGIDPYLGRNAGLRRYSGKRAGVR